MPSLMKGRPWSIYFPLHPMITRDQNTKIFELLNPRLIIFDLDGAVQFFLVMNHDLRGPTRCSPVKAEGHSLKTPAESPLLKKKIEENKTPRNSTPETALRSCPWWHHKRDQSNLHWVQTCLEIRNRSYFDYTRTVKHPQRHIFTRQQPLQNS